MPSDAVGVLAIRPSAIFADPAMKPLSGMADESLAQLWQLLQLSADQKLSVADIEAIIGYITKLTSHAKGNQSSRPKLTSVSNASQKRGSPQRFCEASLNLELILGRLQSTFGFRGGLVMIRATHDFVSEQIGDDFAPICPSLVRNAPRMAAGLEWTHGLDFPAFLTCKDGTAAKQLRPDVRDVLLMLRMAMDPAWQYTFAAESSQQKVEPGSLPPEIALQERLWQNLMTHSHVTRQKNIVCVHTNAKINVADLVKMILSNPMSQKTPDKKDRDNSPNH